MKRSPIIRRPRRNRTLNREAWQRLRDLVVRRDARIVLEYARKRLGIKKLEMHGTIERPLPWCPAVVMDPSLWGSCWGEWRLDHVKTEPRMGVKADDDERSLVSLCGAHDERGLKAGHQWNTAHRDEERIYLAAIYGGADPDVEVEKGGVVADG